MCAAGTGIYEEELLERTRVYLPVCADVVLDPSPLATFEVMPEARRLSRRLERRFRALLDTLRHASQRVFSSVSSCMQALRRS